MAMAMAIAVAITMAMATAMATTKGMITQFGGLVFSFFCLFIYLSMFEVTK